MAKQLGPLEKNLKILRFENNLRQADVAAQLGISQQMYSRYESGTAAVDSDMLRKLCLFYGVSADFLLGLNNGRQREGSPEIEEIVNKVLSRMREGEAQGAQNGLPPKGKPPRMTRGN